MTWLFWIAAIAILYTYAGFPAWLFLRARFHPLPTQPKPFRGPVSIVIAAYNEAKNIGRKIDNLAFLGLLEEPYEVIVVSDGSTDATESIILDRQKPRIRLLKQPQRLGKAVALNRGVAETKGEVVIFMDARQTIEPGAVDAMLAHFSDSSVGCVSGALLMGDEHSTQGPVGESVKMEIENRMRSWEGQSGSMIGALGAFYAARRSLIVEIPAGLLLDDMYIPLHVIRQHHRVVLEDKARAWDDLKPTITQEFWRKVRTLGGNYQLLRSAPWLIGPSNPVWFEFFSHKILRLASPFILLTLLFTSFALPQPIYRAAAILQTAMYASALIAPLTPRMSSTLRFPNLALTFSILNAAAFVAFVSFVRGKTADWGK